MVKPFFLNDGRDAQVRVQIGTGLVEKIEDNPSGNVKVTFNVKDLKFPPNGWTNPEEQQALVALLRGAQADGNTVEYRIESQRKSNVDPTTPMAELLANNPSQTVRSILSAVRLHGSDPWTVSSETVTDIDLDPQPGGRVPATRGSTTPAAANPATRPAVDTGGALDTLRTAVAEGSFTEPVLAQLAALALAQGAAAREVHEALYSAGRDGKSQPAARASFSVEAPAWKDYNSDGRQNLGRASVQATVGVERFARTQLGADATVETLRQYTRGLLALADVIQRDAYGSGFKADRSASSHSVIRSIIYDTLERRATPTLPVEFPASSWWTDLRGEVESRYNLAIDLAEEPTWESLFGERVPSQQNAPATPSSPPQQVAPVAEQPVATEAEEVDAVPSSQDTQNWTQAIQSLDTQTPEKVQEPAMLPGSLPIDEGTLDASGHVKREFAPDQTVKEEFRDYVVATELEPQSLPRIIGVLRETFGSRFGSPTNIGSQELGDFIDFFASTEQGNFKRAVNSIRLTVDESMLDTEGNVRAEYAPTKATQDSFRSLVETSDVPREQYPNIVKLLHLTYGPRFGRASNLPQQELADFVGLFQVLGGDQFAHAVESVDG